MGDFKGIMLCDRPAAPDKIKKANEHKGFHLGAPIPEPLGLNPIPKLFPESAKPKIETAQQKHAKFLKELKAQGLEKTAEAAAKEEEEAARRRKIAEDAAAMRQTILHGDALNAARAAEAEAALAAEEAAAAAAEGAAAEAERLASNALATAAPTEDISAAVLAMKRSKPPKPVVNKPAWAMTADEAEEQEIAEAEALLTFAQTLDFDEYLDETEKKDLGKALKTLAELEFEEEMKKYPIGAQSDWAESFVAAVNALVSEEQRKGAAAGGAQGEGGSVVGGGKAASVATSYMRAKAKAAASDGGWDSSTVVGAAGRKPESSASLAEAAAEDLLRENANLRAVHSKQSVAKMVEAAAAAAARDQQAGEQAAAAS